MATFTDNFALVKSTYGELADVAVINENMDTIDGIMHSNRTMLAPAFSQTEDYAEGDVVVYEGNLYRFIVPHTAGNWDGSEVEQTTLGEEVATKGGADVTKTASGNPITFDDGASAPLVKCVTEIQGSQDLHGYDKPWVGGSGKNKLEVTGSSTTVSGVTFTVNSDGTILVNGTATADIQYNVISNWSAFPAGNYILNGCPSGLSNMNLYVNPDRTQAYYDNGSGVSFSVTSGIIVRIYMATGVTANNVLFKPMIRLSTETDPTFEPYTNICPITAYTEGEISVRGKNLFNPNDPDFKAGYAISPSTGTVYQTSSRNWNTSGYIPVEASTAYRLDTGVSVSSDVVWFDENKQYISGYTSMTTRTAPANARYFRFDYPASATQVMFTKGTELYDYEPYTSTTHTTTFPSAIYRGSEDVVNGEVTSDTVYEEFDGTATVAFGRSGQSNWYYTITSSVTLSSAALPISNKYVGASVLNDNNALGIYKLANGSIRIRVGGTQPSDTSGFLAELANTPLQVVSQTEPTTSSVTPTNLPIKSLSGYNHIESTTGDMEVEYIAQDYQPIVDLIESGNGHTYSTSEQIVGKWTDGKDVYEKTIYYATLSCDRSDWSQLEALDAETFISYSATAHMETASGRQIDNNYIRISYYNGYLYHHEPEFGTGMVDLYVTVRYTKSSSNTRSLNLTKSAVTEEIPDEIKNAPFEEKPETNEADDDAPTEANER